MQLSRRGSSLQRTSIPEESPSQGPLAFRKALKNPRFPGGQAQATKPLRGLGKLLATLAKAVIIITPATIILEGGIRVEQMWQGLSHPLPYYDPRTKLPQNQSLLRSPEKIKSLPGTTLLDYPFYAQETPSYQQELLKRCKV